ncbi:hypothetical protein BBK36DRAFT_1165576 [Trichoderma citrinoviride]|uniref:Uncharacterized protein n=1 Tax=Trichoderma citrinoviride TaxID=58853 RepID=A0A2T4BIZ5_9HYPO|nr:hypothetical protein BBK36DRAFT_1165576 [Trichoderma citrinoviride]PTB69294.1 hypothetical protein BBK36DRAFT_1165576 [Trichoderma citrinoviride]
MSLCPTNEDLEFTSLRCSLCLQLCNATPNFKPPEEQASEWLVSRYGRDVNPYSELTSNAPCGLCALYARAWTRLELAICDQEVDDSRPVPYCLADATGFGACLPLFGCIIGSLQYAVRSYFGINGTKKQDCADGCCAPLVTLVRNEQEIILRENLRRATEREQAKQYVCYAPMAYPTTKLAPRAVRAAQVQGSASDIKAPGIIMRVQSPHEDVSQPSKGNRRVHGLEDDLTAPARTKRREHGLHEDIETATPPKPVPHDLGETVS